MKLFSVFVIAFILNVLPAKSTPFFTPKPAVDTALEKAKKLHVLYLRETAAKDPAQIAYYQRQFFYEFPNNFRMLNKLYGTTNGKPGYLNEVADKHISDVFNIITAIGDTAYYTKIIAIAADGVWDTYGVNYFQTGLKMRVLKNADLAMYLVLRLPAKKVSNFWHFFFDSLYPEREIPNYLKEAASVNQNLYNLMVAAHQAVMNERDSDANPVGEK